MTIGESGSPLSLFFMAYLSEQLKLMTLPVKSNTVTMITVPIYEFHLAKCPLL